MLVGCWLVAGWLLVTKLQGTRFDTITPHGDRSRNQVEHDWEQVSDTIRTSSGSSLRYKENTETICQHIHIFGILHIYKIAPSVRRGEGGGRSCDGEETGRADGVREATQLAAGMADVGCTEARHGKTVSPVRSARGRVATRPPAPSPTHPPTHPHWHAPPDRRPPPQVRHPIPVQVN